MNLNEIFTVRFFQYSFKKFPKLSYFFLLFFALNVFFILIKLEALPFFLYGMYSEKIPPTTQFKTVSLLVNGKEIKEYNLSGREYEFLSSAMEGYVNMKRNGGIDPVQTRVESRYSFLAKSSLYPLIKDRVFNPPSALPRFEPWFRKQCATMLDVPIRTVEVQEHYYRYNVATHSATHLKTEPVARF